jgi:DNA-binding MarR family transcriptional regulator
MHRLAYFKFKEKKRKWISFIFVGHFDDSLLAIHYLGSSSRWNVMRHMFHVIISLFEDGVNQRWIAEILGVSQSGVSKFLKRFNQRESCENERQNGWPRKTDDRGDGKILLCVKTDRRQSLTEITNKVNNVLPIVILEQILVSWEMASNSRP